MEGGREREGEGEREGGREGEREGEGGREGDPHIHLIVTVHAVKPNKYLKYIIVSLFFLKQLSSFECAVTAVTVLTSLSQGMMQVSWKRWLQGSFLSLLSTLKASLQTVHPSTSAPQ